MDLKSSLNPIMGVVVEKALQAAGIHNTNDITKAKNAALNDQEVTTKIDAVVAEPTKPPPETFDRLRAIVRPVVTLLLTFTFVFLIASPFIKWFKLTDLKDWNQIFASFMGVFGTIIGFWFGERTALKVPGGEQAKEIAAKAGENVAEALEKARSNNPDSQG